jgi:hypothetical protein
MPIVLLVALAFVLVVAVAVTPAIAKSGVVLDDPLKPTTEAIKIAAERAFAEWNLTAVITSGRDGVHMASSKHYTGDALDFRRWQSDAIGRTTQIVEHMRSLLGSEFDVVLERTHIHAEYDPA